MALQSLKERNHVLRFVELDAKTAEIPIMHTIFDFKEAVDRRQRRLLVGILDVSKAYCMWNPQVAQVARNARRHGSLTQLESVLSFVIQSLDKWMMQSEEFVDLVSTNSL